VRGWTWPDGLPGLGGSGGRVAEYDPSVEYVKFAATRPSYIAAHAPRSGTARVADSGRLQAEGWSAQTLALCPSWEFPRITAACLGASEWKSDVVQIYLTRRVPL
jgi:hypothetical protein